MKVFSVTKARDRAALGEVVTAWLQGSGLEVVRQEVRQSSDREFHCVSIVLFCRCKGGPVGAAT